MSITDIYIYGLLQLMTEPTRITPTSATLTDVIFTNCSDRIVCSGVRHISISDHSIVFAYRKLFINGTSGGHNERDNDVASQSWDQMYCSTNPNDMWLQWKKVVSLYCWQIKHALLRTMRVQWYCASIVSVIFRGPHTN